MRRALILGLLLPVLFSCQESGKQRLTRLVQE